MTSTEVAATPSLGRRLWAWTASPVPLARVARLRLVAYPFVFVDVLWTTAWVRAHEHVPAVLHRPLALGRLLELPAPGPVLVPVLLLSLLASAAVAATGRLPRVAGAAVFVLYLWWMLVAFGYGKVDHDRFAFLVLLAVLPTVGGAGTGDGRRSEAAGWAIRCVQLAVVATYALSAVAKLRYVGPEWVTSTVLLRAIARRGTALADPLAEVPLLLVATQAAIVALELLSPLLLVPGRPRRLGVAVAASFHLVTFATIRIIFLPHLVCLLAFLPLERLPARLPGLAVDADRRAVVRGGVTAPP